MAEFIIDDDIDFDAYMQATESDHRVVSADSFIDDVIDYFHNEEAPKGAAMPWQKTANVIRFRQGEVTLWTGMNGHGKSLVLGQTCVSLVMQKERVCIASLEMKPKVTLARICRQASMERKPSIEFIRTFGEVTGSWMLLYDQQGTVQADKMIALMRYCAVKREVKHFVLDSFMKCGGIADDDYTRQKFFLDQICSVARDSGMHIHIVAHSRKAKDELSPPGKMDVKGSGSITDQVDNVLTVWRNKSKERAKDEGKAHDESEPDALLICDKQRNGEWEGRIPLWFHPDSQQFLEQDSAHAMDLFRPPVTWI